MPSTDGPELHVHRQRKLHGIAREERELIIVVLTRYAVWCAKERRIDRLRNAIDLLVEVAAGLTMTAPAQYRRRDRRPAADRHPPNGAWSRMSGRP